MVIVLFKYLQLQPIGIVVLCIGLNIQSCGIDVEDPKLPKSPTWVHKSFPEEWPERGIDAHETNGIYLEWEPNGGTDISAYHIYRATYYEYNDSLGHYEFLARQV